MHEERVTGFATEAGGRTSHAAIMARSLEIPAVVGLHEVTRRSDQGETIIVDGTLGLARLPVRLGGPGVLPRAQAQVRGVRDGSLLTLKDYPAVTLDGTASSNLAANIEMPDEVDSAISHGAEGIGLFRTEYLFIARDELPSEDEQYEAYRARRRGDGARRRS